MIKVGISGPVPNLQGRKKGPQVGLVTNGQWCNQPHQYNKAFIESQKDFMESLGGRAQEVVHGVYGHSGLPSYLELCSSPSWLLTCSFVKPLWLSAQCSPELPEPF